MFTAKAIRAKWEYPLWLYFLLGGGGTGLKFHYLVYKGWSIWYSAIIYFLGMLYLRWQLFFIRSR